MNYYWGTTCAVLIFVILQFQSVLTLNTIHYNGTTSTLKINDLTVIGKVKKTGYRNITYSSFFGIPYAEPPIGNLRFKPPVPLPISSHNNTLNALYEGHSCVQYDNTTIIGSEDCLKLNIYVPKTSKVLPVLVFVYGGAFVEGTDHFRLYDPDYFLDEQIIVVTVNYRLGVFGFLSTEDLVSPGNYGLKDQILALKWIKQNIHYFNGDPQKITINGQSAGAASVTYLLQTKLTKGLFHGIIAESGSTLTLWSLTRTAQKVTSSMAALLNVDTTNSSTIVEGLRKVNYRDLQRASGITYLGQLLASNPLDGLPFGPTTEPPHPGAVVTNSSYYKLANGEFHKMPFLMGFNSLEGLPFINALNNIPWFYLKFDLNPTSLVPASMNIDSVAKQMKVNKQISKEYFDYVPLLLSTTEKKSLYVSDDEFVRPIVETARLCSKETSVYLYKFSYKQNKTSLGVGHAEELNYLWKSSLNLQSSSDVLTIRRMIRLWTNFVKTGNPTPKMDPLLENIKWPITTAYGKSKLMYVDIGEKLVIGSNPNSKAITFWDNLFNKYGVPPYSTY